MHRFYVNPNQISDGAVSITGSDVNHIRNVLRMKQDGEIIICNGQGKDCYCIIKKVSEHEISAEVISKKNTDTELKARITLFQGLPKQDKMELIIQKAVELGVYEIVPVLTKRVIVKPDDRKGGFEDSEIERAAAEGLQLITLGRRILRTETAGLAIISMMILMPEED